jgi:seryl-tRNA synthetase
MKGEMIMLDIRFIRENPTLIQQVANHKGIEISIDELLVYDKKRRDLLKDVEQFRSERNRLSQEISHFARQGKVEEQEQTKEQVRAINTQIKQVDDQLRVTEHIFQELMQLVPNVVSQDTPIGASDEDNVEIRRVGDIPTFDFESKDHILLGEMHDLFDIPRGVKIAGTRNYFLKGAGLYLHRAVQQLALDLLTEQGFTAMDVPLMMREDTLYNTGFFPLGREQTYELEKEEKWLVGTAEVPLVSYYSNEEVDVSKPLRLAAVSNCFRREAGSGGRDVRGLYRVHQFAKVEQVIICKDDLDLAEEMLQEITKNAEDFLQLLELPYRVVSVCTGDMGQKNYKQYDIETWMPSRQSYGETHSSSSLLEFQARRSMIRYRDDQEQLRFCYTLNNTAVASPRILIPLLENHQQEDGSIYIPHALRKYMNGITMIGQQ